MHIRNHRELKLDGERGKGKFVTTSKVKNIQNPSSPILEKINENYGQKNFFGYHEALKMGHQSYLLLYSKITTFLPSEWEFSENLAIFSKVKIFQNSFLAIMMH